MTDALLAIVGSRPMSLAAIIAELREQGYHQSRGVYEALCECVDRGWLVRDGVGWRSA